MANFLGPPCI